MAFFSRYKSAPQLDAAGDDSNMALDINHQTDGEYNNEDNEKMVSQAGGDNNTSTRECGDTNIRSLSDEVTDVSAVKMSGLLSQTARRKKRLADMPRRIPSGMTYSHSYSCGLDTVGFQSSTSFESTASDSKILGQTSTDIELFTLEVTCSSDYGDEFPVESTAPNVSSDDFAQSTKTPSRLNKLRQAFRSPQIGRKKLSKDKSFEESPPRLKSSKSEDGILVKMKKLKADDKSKSPKKDRSDSLDSIVEIADWVLAVGYATLGVDQEFEVTRISDYGTYLAGLLAETDPSHPDYLDLSQAVTNLNSTDIVHKCSDPFRILEGLSSVHKLRSTGEVPKITKETSDENYNDNRTVAMDTLEDGPVNELGGLNVLSQHNGSSNNNNSSSSSNNNNSTIIIDNHLMNNNSHDEEPAKLSNTTRGLSLRRMSAPGALLFKSLSGHRGKSSNSLWSSNSLSKKDQDLVSHFRVTDGDSARMLIMEGSVQFAMGMQVQERYLFLFSDLLLVTKQKSSTAYRLKDRVPLCDIWMASCLEEVAETTRPADQSFVIGWPTQNVVATFPRPDIKDYWQTKLKEYINLDKLKDKDKQMQLTVTPRDIDNATQSNYQVTINNLTEAKDVLLACLRQLNIPEHEAKDYQLWVLSGKEGSPYPLIGHETPYSIKLSHIRGLPRSKSGDSIDSMTVSGLDSLVDSSSSGYKCDFYLKHKKFGKKSHFEDSAFSKPVKKNKKSPNIFNTLFRKRRPTQHLVFGLPLSDVCDENLDPPQSIIKLMVLVYQQGPQTPGILRRGNKATLSKEIRDKIDSGGSYPLEDHMAPTAASVFKEFLRSIPEGLLVNDLYEHWTTIKKDDSRTEKITKVKTILARLPPVHYRMLKLTISLLQHLAKYSSHNHMGPSNLATCIAPSFYAYDVAASPQSRLKGENLRQMQMQNSVNDIQNVFVPLISFMIVHHVELFGKDILTMFTKYGCQPSPSLYLHEDRQGIQMQPSLEEDEQEDMVIEEEQDDEIGYSQHSQEQRMIQRQQQEHTQHDSNSATDSDSMHSVLSMQDTGMDLRNNDSSTDSLVEREHFFPDADFSPRVAKSHISPSNLSRDSGLTLSDTQLYDEEAFQADAVNIPTRMYQRSASHMTENEYSQKSFHQNIGNHGNKPVNPVAPPRRRSSKLRRDPSEGVDSDQFAFSSHLVLTKSNSGKVQLDENLTSERSTELKPLLSHPLLDKRVSSDSIGEEDETEEQFRPIDYETFRATASKYIVSRKSESSTDPTITKYQLGSTGNKPKHRFVRQSSVVDNTPPVSPQSRHSQSSRDSVISDSAYSASQDGSVHSAPQTPDEPVYKSSVWAPDAILPGKSWNDTVVAHNLNLQHSIPYSRSTSDLLSDADRTDKDVLEHVAQGHHSSPKLWPGKFHEAEEVEMSGHSHLCQDVGSKSYLSPPLSFHVSPVTSPSESQQCKTRWSASYFDKGSPPPKVILQSLQTPFKQETGPARGSHHRPTSTRPESSRLSFDPSMTSLRQEDYVNVTSKPIIITASGSMASTLDSVASRRARLSKYMSSSLNLPLSLRNKDLVIPEPRRPEKPPNYQQALERNFMMKHNVPLDIVHAKDTVGAKTVHDLNQNHSVIKCTRPSDHNAGFCSCITSTDSLDMDNNKKSAVNSGRPEALSLLNKHSMPSDQVDARRPASLSSINNNRSRTLLTKQASLTDSTRPILNSQHVHLVTDNRQDCGSGAVEQGSQGSAAVKKDPEKLYLQSVQIYEQKRSAPVASVTAPFKNNHPLQTADNAFRSPQKSSMTSFQDMSAQKTKDSVQSNLEVPTSSLHRNHSLSAEHLYSRPETLKPSSSHQPYSDRDADLRPALGQRDIQAEIHQNFIKARSYFSQSQDDHYISPEASGNFPSHQLPLENRINKCSPKSIKSAISTEDMTVHSASVLGFQTKVPSREIHITNPALMEISHKRQIHWSVKDLRTMYDKSRDITHRGSTENLSSNIQSTSHTSQSRNPPPPYQNPPPFKNKESEHVSNTTKPSPSEISQRHGPQSFIYDGNRSYSSSEDSYISSIDRHSVRSGDSNNDSEALSDYTNITYV